ncbi:MAG: hypothetical protein GY749_44460 [Desulfobacteraceae bacterium]|nr:hypothetical protein [Desulfobacteraceae bacterium]
MQKELFSSVDKMVRNIVGFLDDLKNNNTTEIADGLEKWLHKAFEQYFSRISEIRERLPVSSRGEKTYIFPWADKDTYADPVSDRKRFRAEVVEKFGGYAHATGHKSACKISGKYKMIGFRAVPRKVVMVGGKQEIFRIRMVQCFTVYPKLDNFLITMHINKYLY